MIIEEIKKANITALKNKDTIARNIYSVVLNKIMLEQIKKREKGEEMKDGDVLVILQKALKELEEEKAGYEKVGNKEKVEYIKTQQKIIQNYMPKMLTEQEIFHIIANLADKSIGSVMKKFKTEYAGTCDMKLVQEVLKRF
ncbi:MAG: GatB/YqeY domain-containing protein [Clostridia bacterium]|nr:GatB/YqeY domain-containing protein [Clostridia bacterium]